MMWNPPWTFPVVLPLGLVDWHVALGAWTAALLAAALWGSWLTWTAYGGPSELRWFVVPLVLAYAPAFTMVRYGQLPGFIFLGLAGFLSATKANRPVLAGVAAAATAMKPHLLLPFGVLLACHATVNRSARVSALAGAAVLAVGAVVPTLWKPDVWRLWDAALSAPSDEFHHATSDWALPTFACRLRGGLDLPLWTQFVPSAVATSGLMIYWWMRRADWDWGREVPRVVLVSVLTTGYGGMGFDLVVLLLPVVQATTWVANQRPEAGFRLMLAYLALNALAMLLVIPFPWWTPATLVGYVAVGWWLRPS